MLNDIKDQDQIRVIPPEVVEWVFSKSDVSCTGVLTGMEIARALCAYEVWVGKRTQNYYAPDSMLIGLVNVGKLPAPTRLKDGEWKEYLETRAQVLEVLLPYDMDGDSAFTGSDICGLLVHLGWSK